MPQTNLIKLQNDYWFKAFSPQTAKYYRSQGIIATSKNINILVFAFKNWVWWISKHIIILQAYIETKPGILFNIYHLSPSYIFRIYTKENNLFIASPNEFLKRGREKPI